MTCSILMKEVKRRVVLVQKSFGDEFIILATVKLLRVVVPCILV